MIAVVTWYDENYSEIGDMTSELTSRYCQTHGYKLEVSSERRTKRKCNWEKLPALLNVIHKYELVVWVDADAFFRVDAPPLDDLLEKYNKDAILSCDRPWTGGGPGGPDINSGVFILRNTPWSKDFLQTWLFDEDLFRRRIRPWHDQGVLRLMYQEDEDVRNHSDVSPLGELQSFGVGPGLVIHYTDCVARGKIKRLAAINRYAERNKE